MVPSLGVNLRVTGHCNQGGRKYMEDAFVVAYQQTEDEKDLEYAYFGIFDGHGGKEAALFAKEHLMNCIVNQKNFWSEDDNNVLKAIRDGFVATHLAMWKEVGNWPKTMSGLPSTSGTTSSVAFIRHGKLYIGHVGDSKIVLGYQDSTSDKWLPQSLTRDHKPESPREKKRINSVGGLVMSKAGVERVVWNRPRVGHKGPIRRSTHFDQIPFLAVARSLGDLWSYNYLKREFVVSPEPDVGVFPVDPRRARCIILGSDGLWNMVSTRDAVCLVQRAEEENEQRILEGGGANGVGKPANNPSKLLVDKALFLWFDLGMRADNTSVVTVLLDPPGPPKSEVLLRQKIMQKLRPRDDLGEMDVPPPPPPQYLTDSECRHMKRPSSFSGYETSDDPLPKERKRISNSHDLRTSNLPKPVILSPHRVSKAPHPTPSSPDDKPKSVPSEKCDLLEQPKMKDDDNPLSHKDVSESSDNSNYHVTDESASYVKDATNVHSDSPKSETTTNSPRKENHCDSDKSPATDTPKDNGRTHLSEVDNIVEDRLSERSKSAQENGNIIKKAKDKDVSPSTQKRRLQEDIESSISPKNVKLGSDSWTRDSPSSCQVTSAKELIHNTRSQQRNSNRKVKI